MQFNPISMYWVSLYARHTAEGKMSKKVLAFEDLKV